MAWLLDGGVLLAYFVTVINIGLYKDRGDKTMEAFAVGNRSIPWWAVLASILAAEISAATFLGAPDEGYASRNYTYAQLAIGTLLARVIVALVFIKPYYDFRVVSIYEFLRVRFGERTKNGASAVFLITRALASGTRLYVAAVVLVLGYEMFSGVTLAPLQQVWIYIGSLLFLTAATAIYTALGGIKAVIWTDVIQAAVMFGSLAFAVWSLLHAIPGGWQGAMALLNAPKDMIFFDSGTEQNASFLENVRNVLGTEYTLWAALFGSTFITMATHGTDQDMVQRMLTAKNAAKSRLALILSGLADLPIVLCFLTIGILLWAFYQKQEMPHPFAYYILHEMPRAWSDDRGSLRHGDGVTFHSPQRPGHQFYDPAACRCRRAQDHGCLFGDPGCHRLGHCLCLAFEGDSHCARHLWVHLRLTPGCFSGGDAHQDARQREGQSRGDGMRIHRRRDPERAAQRYLESAASFGPQPSRLDGRASERPGFSALALGLAAHHRFPMADHRRDVGDSCRGFDLPHPARAREIMRERIADWGGAHKPPGHGPARLMLITHRGPQPGGSSPHRQGIRAICAGPIQMIPNSWRAKSWQYRGDLLWRSLICGGFRLRARTREQAG